MGGTDVNKVDFRVLELLKIMSGTELSRLLSAIEGVNSNRPPSVNSIQSVIRNANASK
jgi:hypothetical protein